MSHTILEPKIDGPGTRNGRWMVTIFNNDTNSVDEVIFILMHATGCNRQEAEIETWEAHHFGKAPVHFSSKTECNQVAELISSIGVKTEVEPEWSEA